MQPNSTLIVNNLLQVEGDVLLGDMGQGVVCLAAWNSEITVYHQHKLVLCCNLLQVEGDVLLGDMGQGVPLRQGVFDGAISISAVQWLCNADRSSHEPRKRLKAFFESLYRCLARGARAVLQVYPENATQAEMMVAAAMKVSLAAAAGADGSCWHVTVAVTQFFAHVLMQLIPSASAGLGW